MESDQRLRVQGVSLSDVSDYRNPLPAGRWSQFFSALSRQVNLVGICQPRLPRWRHYTNLARSFSPDRARWVARAGFSLSVTHGLDRALADDLERHRDEYDLVVQLQTLCSPPPDVPYVIYTDNTMALTQRLYPAWAPLSAPQSAAWQRFEAGVCRGAEAVFTYSEFARRSVVEDYGCASESVWAIGAGANQQLSSPKDRRGGGRRAVFVGSPFDRKGGDVLMQAWPLIRERIPDAELLIAGPRRDPAPGFGHDVTWLGHITRAELHDVYSSADVFVMPSRFEPWGHVFVEAMGYGLPCVAADCCAMPELIEDGVTGRLVAPGDGEGLADALTDLLADPELAARMGRAGYERVVGELQWDHVVERLLEHLGR